MAVWALTVIHSTCVLYGSEPGLVVSADGLLALHIPQLPSCTWAYLGRAGPPGPGEFSACSGDDDSKVIERSLKGARHWCRLAR